MCYTGFVECDWLEVVWEANLTEGVLQTSSRFTAKLQGSTLVCCLLFEERKSERKKSIVLGVEERKLEEEETLVCCLLFEERKSER